MNALEILAVIEKGITIINTLQGPLTTALAAVNNIVEKNIDGTLTQEDLDAVEQLLDDQLAVFNAPLPD